jgi:NAD(P)-dependent dehydrogenase (short-subunit alcohol dehydrogenase family)
MRVVALMNAGAGSQAPAQGTRAALDRSFAEHGVDAVLRFLSGTELKAAARDALGLARRGEIDAVVVGGGDGSVRTVAGVLADTGVPLGILPLGTLNHFAKDVGIAVDLKGVFLACQIFGRGMVARKSGSVINISSASSGPPLSKVFTYGVAKGGVNQITQFLAREWAADGVRVNALVPGFFPAEQNRKLLTPDRNALIMAHTPMKRFGEAHELLGAVLWLASDRASSFVTGALIRIDGGFLAMTI